MLNEVARGTAVVVTRDGEPVAELRPLPKRGLTARELVKRRKALPRIDPAELRMDVDAVVDMAL